jgi:hypothetical protein
MKRRIQGIAGCALLGLAVCAGCGGSSSPPPTLTVGTATSPAMVSVLTPPAGRYFVEVPVTLTNPNESPLSGWWYYYALGTQGSLVIEADPNASTLVKDPCSSDTEIVPVTAAGASFTCNLIFDVPCGDVPLGVTYFGGGNHVAAQITPPAPTGC